MRIKIKDIIEYLEEEKKEILFNKEYIKDMSIKERKDSIFYIELLLNKKEKIEYFIKDIDIDKDIYLDYIIDIFENIIYRISKEEYEFLIK